MNAASTDEQLHSDISLSSAALLYGRGVFTTVAIFDGRPFVWAKHWRRLVRDAEKIGLQLAGFNEESVAEELKTAILDREIADGRARITFFDERAGTFWEGGRERTALSILAAEGRRPSGDLRIGVSPCTVNSRSPLAGVKSCNYLENLLAFEEARGRGLNEAIRVSERGQVTSGCMSNVFWLKEGRLFTPALSTGCLPGTTREYVLENLECAEVEAGVDELERADAVFLTSAGIGAAAVGEFDGRKMPVKEHPILELLPG